MKTILVVDDEKNIGRLYQRELSGDGYRVIHAQNGEEALEKLEHCRPDIIVLDVRMPKMDGIETLGRVMEKRLRIPIILNTAYSSYKDDYLTWAADAYVLKSSDLSELKSKIKELLEESSVP